MCYVDEKVFEVILDLKEEEILISGEAANRMNFQLTILRPVILECKSIGELKITAYYFTTLSANRKCFAVIISNITPHFQTAHAEPYSKK